MLLPLLKRHQVCTPQVWFVRSVSGAAIPGLMFFSKVMKRSKRRLFPANGNTDPSVSLFQSASCSIDTNMPQHGTKSDWDAATFFIFPRWQTVSYDLDIFHFHWQKVVTLCNATDNFASRNTVKSETGFFHAQQSLSQLNVGWSDSIWNLLPLLHHPPHQTPINK